MRIRKCLAVLLLLLFLNGCTPDWKQGEVVTIRHSAQTIHVLAGQSTSDAGSENMIQKVLEEAFPEVVFEWTCVDWGSSFEQLMTSKIAAGAIPDIIIGKAQDVAVYQKLDAILPVAEQTAEKIDPDALEQVRIHGVLYGLPYNSFYQGVLYNKGIFRELGVEIPQTRQELYKIVSKCEAAGYTPFALHYGDVWSVANLSMQFWMNDLFRQNPIWGREGNPFSQEDLIRDALEECDYMRQHSYEDVLQVNQIECDRRFALGNVAMYMTGSWSLQVMEQMMTELDLGIFPYPNTTGDASLLEETNMTFMKGNSGKNQELVDEILLELGTNTELARGIEDFTEASSTFTVLREHSDTLMQQLGRPYVEAGQISNVSVGNGQFVWSFQSEMAEKTIAWMKEEITMGEWMATAQKEFNLR